jgi:hypothetical protein
LKKFLKIIILPVYLLFAIPISILGEPISVSISNDGFDMMMSITTTSVDSLSDLHKASRDGDLKTMLECIERKFPINGRTKTSCITINYSSHSLKSYSGKETPLMLAAESGFMEIVDTLISHGAKINLKDTTGASAIEKAAGKGNLEIVMHLLEKGAKDTVGAITSALLASQIPVAQAVLQLKGKINLELAYSNILFSAIKKNDTLVSKFLIDLGISVNSKDRDNATPLLYAIDNSNNYLAEYLIEKGANVNIISK